MLGRLVARHRRNPGVRTVARLATRLVDAYQNVNYQPETNGESRVLEVLGRQSGIRTIFDVGANVGEWSLLAAKHVPTAAIYGFEIVPATADRLRRAVAAQPRIRVNPFGLGSRDGPIKVKHFPNASGFSSTLDFPHTEDFTWIDATIRRGDDYLQEQNLQGIDLLKVDVEGSERDVLDGFSGAFKSETIDVVQVEYGQANVLSGFLLRDIHVYFKERGFAVGKIFPTYVDFREYHPRDEDLRGPNYLAVRLARTDLRDALAGGGPNRNA
jgi:FkbM family methyltransferase